MRIYIRSSNFQLWLVIKNGEEIPMKKVGETTVPKTEDEFDAEDIKKIENYAKAINMLYCAVNPDDYRKISCCTTAKEMWDKLEVTYEGSDQVREAKIDYLTQEYEMFRMKEDKNRAGTSGKSKSKSRAPSTTSEERLYYGDGSYLWFDSEEERTRFLTFFSKRVVAPPRIIPERYPELQGYDDLDAQLHQASLWLFVSRARKEINPALIRAFYSNLRREDDVLYSLVKSTPIELTVEQLGRIAGLPFQGDNVSHYGGEDWVLNNEGLILNELGITELKRHASGRPTIHSANPDGRLVLYIVTRIIKPRKHDHTIMHGEDLKLIHAIMHSAPINWAKFVMINMTIAASTEHDHLLPYPFLVMDILERFKGCFLRRFVEVRVTRTLKMYGFVKHR
ncbi:unnamed protein product [Cuscuta campestris]|uniref:Putative plant transposon protein domain-containing protein n=1 Tax=Cuscuta campestris TaxID=132261 RepID=A0A484LH93_9ASTE|nr:unnamed protein product [Cuscuta campestris]